VRGDKTHSSTFIIANHILASAIAQRREKYYNKLISKWIFNPIEKSDRKEKNAMLFYPKEKGQGLVEYALILVLVAIVVIAALLVLGPVIGNSFSTVNGSLNNIMSG
jgi:pilus assembly protein Flp/PilA